jgi:hypothetical protein
MINIFVYGKSKSEFDPLKSSLYKLLTDGKYKIVDPENSIRKMEKSLLDICRIIFVDSDVVCYKEVGNTGRVIEVKYVKKPGDIDAVGSLISLLRTANLNFSVIGLESEF